MARHVDYTVAYQTEAGVFDLCKIFFGGDGSYYITAPYHPLDRAIAAKMTVNYATLLRRNKGRADDPRRDFLALLSDAQELAAVDDDEKRLKVAHHPDGFLQFSGEGILSGRDENGAPKGIGTFSWPLRMPTLGPSFGLNFHRPELCGRPSASNKRTVVLREADIEHMRFEGIRGLRIVGYYVPPLWREFVHREEDGRLWMHLVHPSAQATKRLRVLMASKESDLPGLIGLEAAPWDMPEWGEDPGFMVTTSSGGLRRNENGDLLGDQLMCAYPRPDLEDVHLPVLAPPLPAPAYEAPAGTTAIVPENEETEPDQQEELDPPPPRSQLAEFADWFRRASTQLSPRRK